MLRTPETPSMPRYRAGKSLAFTPQSRRAVQTPRDRDRMERERMRERGRGRERDDSSSSDRMRHLERKKRYENPPDVRSPPTSPIVMLRVGPQKRLFAAHEAILSASPFFAAQVQSQVQTQTPTPSRIRTPPRHPNKLIDLPDEQAEVLSCVLEFLYKGDYYPRLRHNATKRAWELEDVDTDTAGSDGDGELSQGAMATVYHHRAGCVILRDTAIYCAAQKYNLPVLQRLSLRKQGLHTNISCSTILASARFAYAHTPDTESRLRAHYLALIVRSRSTFMRSGTMQMEMERGGLLFFDLFVALCNHMDDLEPGELVSSSVSTTC